MNLLFVVFATLVYSTHGAPKLNTPKKKSESLYGPCSSKKKCVGNGNAQSGFLDTRESLLQSMLQIKMAEEIYREARGSHEAMSSLR